MRDDILARAGRSGGGRRCWIHRLADSTPCATGGACRAAGAPLAQAARAPDLRRKTARIGDNAGFEASALPPLFESARALWRAEREGIAHRLQRALPGLRKNVYRTDSIEAAFDAWNHYFDLERFAVDVPCVASRAPDSK